MLRIAAATKLDSTAFRRNAPLAHAVARLQFRPAVTMQVAFLNARPLANAFNGILAKAPEDDVLLFTHDDVFFDDWFLDERLAEALARFDVVGVAGNRRRTPRQCGWAFGERVGPRDSEYLSGSIGHVEGLRDVVGTFGPSPAEVKLLDGVFLAARAGTLRGAGVEFDPRFPFHFYDLDFCRSCEKAGLRMGTWPIALTHWSGGSFGSPEWQRAHEAYLTKWGE